MSAVSADNRGPRPVVRLVSLLLAFLAAACFTGETRNNAGPTGVIGPTGGGGGSGGGGGTAGSGTYQLMSVNDTTLPDTLVYDSTTGIGSIGDTERVFAATVLSSLLYLNSDNSAEEITTTVIRDVRVATDSSFNRTDTTADTSAGTFAVSGSTVTVSLIDTVGGTHTVITSYTLSGSALTGLVPFQLYNSEHVVAAVGSANFAYTRTGGPLHQLQRPGPGAGSGSAPGRASRARFSAACLPCALPAPPRTRT
jgi:hypothetical protein